MQDPLEDAVSLKLCLWSFPFKFSRQGDILEEIRFEESVTRGRGFYFITVISKFMLERLLLVSLGSVDKFVFLIVHANRVELCMQLRWIQALEWKFEFIWQSKRCSCYNNKLFKRCPRLSSIGVTLCDKTKQKVGVVLHMKIQCRDNLFCLYKRGRKKHTTLCVMKVRDWEAISMDDSYQVLLSIIFILKLVKNIEDISNHYILVEGREILLHC